MAAAASPNLRQILQNGDIFGRLAESYLSPDDLENLSKVCSSVYRQRFSLHNHVSPAMRPKLSAVPITLDFLATTGGLRKLAALFELGILNVEKVRKLLISGSTYKMDIFQAPDLARAYRRIDEMTDNINPLRSLSMLLRCSSVLKRQLPASRSPGGRGDPEARIQQYRRVFDTLSERQREGIRLLIDDFLSGEIDRYPALDIVNIIDKYVTPEPRRSICPQDCTVL